jgi:hypothetical protein
LFHIVGDSVLSGFLCCLWANLPLDGGRFIPLTKCCVGLYVDGVLPYFSRASIAGDLLVEPPKKKKGDNELLVEETEIRELL